MAFLTKAAILEADDRPTETVEVPEWGGDVLVRGMDSAGRSEYFASQTVIRGTQVTQNLVNVSARLCARCIVDPDTLEPMFTVAEAVELGRKSAAALDRVETVAQRLSGMTEEVSDELKKDSASTQNGGSASGLPPILEGASPKRSARSARSSSPSGPSITP